MAIATINNQTNPVTGPFGFGRSQVFTNTGTSTFTIPAGVNNLRVRVWGGGSSGNASTFAGTGGGFALETIYNLTGVTSVVVTVGVGGSSSAGGTSSFGSYCSATGGAYATGVGGSGSGGDINFTGGSSTSAGTNAGGGGAANLFGNGGNGSTSASTQGGSGASGGGGGNSTNTMGGSGVNSMGAYYVSTTSSFPATTGQPPSFSYDFVGTGGGGAGTAPGINGGGGAGTSNGGFPGGGGGWSTSYTGAAGMVIVEW